MRFVLFFLSCLSFFDCSGQTVQDYLQSGSEKYKQYQIKEAISDYRQALVLDSNNIAAYYALGEAESWRMSYDSAIYFYTKSIRMSDNSTYGLFNRGRTYYYKGDYEKALNDFNQLIGREEKFLPLNAEVRAIIRYRAHHFYGAIDDLTKVINDRAYVQDLFLRARCYQHTNQDSLAHEDFAALIREEQQNNHVLYSAYAFYYSGKKEKA